MISREIVPVFEDNIKFAICNLLSPKASAPVDLKIQAVTCLAQKIRRSLRAWGREEGISMQPLSVDPIEPPSSANGTTTTQHYYNYYHSAPSNERSPLHVPSGYHSNRRGAFIFVCLLGNSLQQSTIQTCNPPSSSSQFRGFCMSAIALGHFTMFHHVNNWQGADTDEPSWNSADLGGGAAVMGFFVSPASS